MSLSSPLGLMRHLRKPDQRLEMVPWLNVLVLAWLLTLLGSRFIYAPGLAVSLDGSTNALPASLDLPQISGGALPGQPTAAELTVRTGKGNTLFILENGIHRLEDLEGPLKNIRRNLPKNAPRVLLLKADRDLPLQTFLNVCDLARAAGFSTVQVAAKEAGTAAATTAPPDKVQTPDAPPAATTTP